MGMWMETIFSYSTGHEYEYMDIMIWFILIRGFDHLKYYDLLFRFGYVNVLVHVGYSISIWMGTDMCMKFRWKNMRMEISLSDPTDMNMSIMLIF